jgi:hypothetical protein
MATIKRILVSVSLIGLFSASGCAAGYSDRVEYLRVVGLRGIEVHNLLSAQNTKVTEPGCKNANSALNGDMPSFGSPPAQAELDAYRALVEQTFVKACVLGEY